MTKGILQNQDNIIIYDSEQYTDQQSATSKLKTIDFNDDEFGFTIKYDYFIEISGKTYYELIISSNGDLQYKIKEDKSNYSQYIIRHHNIQQRRISKFRNNQIIKDVYEFSYGFTIEIERDQTKLSFKDIGYVYSKGRIDFGKRGFKFNGSLCVREQYKGEINIEKHMFSNIEIKYEQKRFKDMKSFRDHISSKLDLNISDPYRNINCIATRDQSLNKRIFREMTDDIKKSENCLIF